MKKPVKFLLVITTLVLCFAFAGVNMAQADEISWKNPTIYQYVNNPYVRTTIVQASELPAPIPMKMDCTNQTVLP